MRCYSLTANRSRLTRVLLAVTLLLPPGVAAAQSPAPATLLISVRDSAGKPLAGAAVHVQQQGAAQGQDCHTDAQGSCRFAALPPGACTVSAMMTGYGQVSRGPISIQAAERQQITLTLPPSSAAQKSLDSVQFFEQPQFTIAGVTDPTSLGGHGSNAAAPAKDALSREVVALGGSASAAPPPPPSSEQALRQAAARHPTDFDANYRLGKLLLAQGQPSQALPYLQQASRLKPRDTRNNYELALAYSGAGDYARARATLQPLLAARDTADLHHLLGDIEEKSGHSVAAEREYQRAAQLAPSEANVFDWGAELLLHRAAEPAREVFHKGSRLFPQSARMLLGLGAAWFAQGAYDRAAAYFCRASDLAPADPHPYLFLGQVQEVESAPSAQVAARLERFLRLQPENARANYYYALNLWKRAEGGGNPAALSQAGALLRKAVSLDPGFAAGYLQLGILYAGQKQYPQAISWYKKAIAADPRLPDAHYRLAQAYMRAGDPAGGRAELRAYQQLAQQNAQAAQRSRMQQFVYTLRGQTSAAAPR
jgi:tetratricopeptide (TPR) repeat protein